jgi:beta-lactamase superfamily II metal-dependent hydrolase
MTVRVLFAVLMLPIAASADITVGPEDVYIRVVDVGPGLCTVVAAPGGSYMVYDAGHWVGGKCIAAVREIVQGGEIDLLVISHSDGDHLGDGDYILVEYRVRQIISTGERREGKVNWENLHNAIASEVKDQDASVLNLQSVDLVPNTRASVGPALVTFLGGWGEWTHTAIADEGERKNAISIVARVDYRGSSVLLPGDTVGRRRTDSDDACKDAEALLAERHDFGEIWLDADVVVAPHHGGNNGSSACFIERVSPEYVIFSAGHDHLHPTNGAAGRYLAFGVPEQNILRTDFGDDEPLEHGGGPRDEWKKHRVPGCTDPRGDNDVEIVLRGDGTLEVTYCEPPGGC